MTEEQWQDSPARFPSDSEYESQITRIWRECGLPEYFIGNKGTNQKLIEFARRVLANGRKFD